MVEQEARGMHLKLCRQKKKMTLQDLSKLTGLSVSFLSKIENGVGNPSINNVQKICYALSITANELMGTKTDDELFSTIHENKSYVQNNTERRMIYNFADVVRFESIFEGNPHFKLNVMTLAGGARERFSSTHSYDEFGIVARGTMALELDGRDYYELVEGDCIMIRAQTSHTSIAISPEECISYWVEILDKPNV